MMLFSELICACTVLSAFSIVQVDLALERALVDRDLRHPLHLLAPVVADEIVGQIDDVGLVGGVASATPAGRLAATIAATASQWLEASSSFLLWSEAGEADCSALCHPPMIMIPVSEITVNGRPCSRTRRAFGMPAPSVRCPRPPWA